MFGQVMQIPKDFQDYDDDDDKVNRRLSRWNYWKNLRKLRSEFTEQNSSTDHYAFIDWLAKTHGFKPVLNNDLQYTDEFVVTDEKKFIVYVLKYG